MVVEILKRSIIGIAIGAIFTFIALTGMIIGDAEASIAEVWKYMLGNLLIGTYFGLSSFLYEFDKWSPLKRTIIHFSLSITVYFIIAFAVDWLPFQPLSFLIGALLFISAYILFWAGAQFFAKRLASSMNEYLDKKR
ncbi:DUF3021 domain-containing protein [Virgibacillus salexigens]|uniref:DUF3021 domain-containing protein n=1 Tax=Virgibacillus kapii TaxID=1638645 RepID=A0ABQ2DRA6_9BACI|nr:DUF3021 domain-containing protein [Virgibacillus kapii]GGJ67473.1 hypothetical protein GCM10007111_31710 [Virgibacillus kapii]